MAEPAMREPEQIRRKWPAKLAGKKCRDVSQDRDVSDEWIGREPLCPWEAKVYAAL